MADGPRWAAPHDAPAAQLAAARRRLTVHQDLLPMMGSAYPKFGEVFVGTALAVGRSRMTTRLLRNARELTQHSALARFQRDVDPSRQGTGPTAPHGLLPKPRRGSGQEAELLPLPAPGPFPRAPLTGAVAVRPERKRFRRRDPTGVFPMSAACGRVIPGLISHCDCAGGRRGTFHVEHRRTRWTPARALPTPMVRPVGDPR
jgi:hypothetical protein